MARRVQSLDWSSTALGSIESWPDRLKAAVDMVLASPLVSSAALTDDRLLIYNDVAARLYDSRHPLALGRPLRETFPDSYPSVKALYDRVFAGESVEVHEQPLAVGTKEHAEVFDAYLTPVRAADGTIIGAYMVGQEVSERSRTLQKAERKRPRRSRSACDDRRRSESPGVTGRHHRIRRRADG